MDPMLNAMWPTRLYNAPVLRDLLGCQHHNKAVSEYLHCAPLAGALQDMHAVQACVSSSVQSMPTVLGENGARMAFASKTARTTRTACKDQSVWTAVVNLAVTNKKIVDLAKFAMQRAAVYVMLDLLSLPMEIVNQVILGYSNHFGTKGNPLRKYINR